MSGSKDVAKQGFDCKAVAEPADLAHAAGSSRQDTAMPSLPVPAHMFSSASIITYVSAL